VITGPRRPDRGADALGGEPSIADAETAEPTEPAALAELARCRTEIERIDKTLVDLLAERVELARAVGRVKRAAGLPTIDPAREAAVVRRAGLLARDARIADEDVREIFWHVIAMARRAQLDGA